MARTGGRKAPKQSASSNPPPNTSPAGPPSPWTYAPLDVSRTFLSVLPAHHIYLANLDDNPRGLKRRVFLVPVCMNLIIAIVLTIRIYYAAPTYLALIITIFGYDTRYKIDTDNSPITNIIGVIGSRTMLFLADYALFTLLGSWPWAFVFGNEQTGYFGPLEWRRALGFQDREIVIRRSRKWDGAITPMWTLDDELTLKHKITPAMEKPFIAKTGYLLLDKDWDLDFGAILKAHQLIKSSTLKFSDFENTAFVHYQKQWLMWPIQKATETAPVKESSTMRAFKEKLAALGCGDLFYRWIELVQFESSMPGGFTEGRKANALREMRTMMMERGVDYGKFWEDIDGEKGMPGLEE